MQTNPMRSIFHLQEQAYGIWSLRNTRISGYKMEITHKQRNKNHNHTKCNRDKQQAKNLTQQKEKKKIQIQKTKGKVGAKLQL